MRASPGCPEQRSAPKPGHRLRWHWPVALVVLLLLLGVWWWFSPRPYRRVAAHPVFDTILVPCDTGYVTREGNTTYILHDWHGHLRWRVETAVPNTRRWQTEIRSPEDILVVSPDGHYAAAAVADWPSTRVQTWRDGVCTGEKVLPTHLTTRDVGTTILPIGLRVLNDGRVFCWVRPRPATMWMLAHGRIQATGRCAAIPPAKHRLDLDSAISQLSPDALTFVTTNGPDFTYATVTVTEHHLAITPRYTLHNKYLSLGREPRFEDDAVLFTRGAVISNEEVYQSGGLVRSTTWITDTISHAGNYTLQHRKHRSRVFNPATGEGWTLTVPDFNNGGDATDSGRYALACYEPPLPRAVMSVARALQWLGLPGLSLRLERLTEDRMRLALYERPGRVRARMRLPAGADVWYPSPDGRAVVVNTGGECLLYRW